MKSIDERFLHVPSPCYVVDETLLQRNLDILQHVMARTGCRILLAQKAFSLYALYPLLGQTLHGTTASGLFEARLAHEEMGGEVHIFSPAYAEEEFDEITRLCDHIVFNSFAQWRRFGPRALARGRSCGMRVNPEHSTQADAHAMYDPCGPFSRLGATRAQFEGESLEGISGLHFHTLCEQNADALSETLRAVESAFGPTLHRMQWINFGGGHHITREDYDIETLIACIRRVQDTYGVSVYLEPGEAVVLGAGFLVATVLETMRNGMDIAILDASAACHMPDVLEVPYRPEVIGAARPGEKPCTVRLTGATCLAGDVIGDYAFDEALTRGDRVVFCDMAHYTMVKNNTFNGMKLPSIAVLRKNGKAEVIRTFGYADFKMRLS